jgi:hypothetical protein
MIGTLFIGLVTDIIPLILLYPFKLDKETFIINIIFLAIYLIYMDDTILNIANIYIGGFNKYRDFTFQDWLKHRINIYYGLNMI